MIREKLVAVLAAFLAVFGVRWPGGPALTYGTGYYTNLCGSGAAANVHRCSGECDSNTGVCKSESFWVAKWVCDGESTQCGENESWANAQSLEGTVCGKTISLNVFDKNCRVGGWTCDESNLKDYMVWYSGDCSPNQVAQATQAPQVIIVTPIVMPTVTLTPTVTASPSATIAPVARQAPETGGGGWSAVRAVAVVGMGWIFLRWARWTWK